MAFCQRMHKQRKMPTEPVGEARQRAGAGRGEATNSRERKQTNGEIS